ncbi:hypothetical protein [Methanofollis fontis]|uniref:hypothetical protein n=1 Tax=Methanofollis fontis TaxID=2052832 RepID=UPI0013EE435D|nr:hypothetical protein [Methanofollis fontis]
MDMDKDALRLEDWKMTKDRISHFDDVIIRLRIQGIPIALSIMVLGALLLPFLSNETVPFLGWNASSLPFLAAALYLFPICLLDIVHYKLLVHAVQHALDIEKEPPFEGTLQITGQLTNPWYTRIHTTVAIIIYLGGHPKTR